MTESRGPGRGEPDWAARVFTAREAKKLAGMTYRQLNDWDGRGAIPSGRAGGAGWRKFSPRDLFALMVCSEIRTRFGVPVDWLRYVMDCMIANDGRDHFRAAIDLMRHGLSVFLLTDLKETFVMDSDLEFQFLLSHGYFRAGVRQGYVFIQVNDVVNRLLAVVGSTLEFKQNDEVYRLKAAAQEKITACTPAEMEVLQLLRRQDCDRVSVVFENSKIARIEVEGAVTLNEMKDASVISGIGKGADFEMVSGARRKGKGATVRRKIVLPVRNEHNERVLFGGKAFAGSRGQ